MNGEIDGLIEEAKGLTAVRYDSPRVDLWERRAKAFVKQHYGPETEEILSTALFPGQMAADEQHAQYMHVQAMGKTIELLEALKRESAVAADTAPHLGGDALQLLTAAHGNSGDAFRLDTNRGTIVQTGTRPGAKRFVIEDTSRARYALEELERAGFLRRETGSHYVVTVDGRDFVEAQTVDNVAARAAVAHEIDAVTGIGNRTYLESASREVFEKCRAAGVPCAAFFMDADDFKAFNQQHGHKVGDKVLHAVAQTASRAIYLRGGVIGRWGGGDEIVATMSNLTLPEVAALGERIRAAMEATPVDGMAVTISVGVASGVGLASVEELWNRADQALHEAKRLGKNRVVSCKEAPTT